MKWLAAVLILVIASSCNRGPDLPPDVLPPEKMQAVLWDILEADELVSYKASMDTGFNNIRSGVGLYKGIFEMHQISEAQFRTSFRYYGSHPRLFRPIIDSLHSKGRRVVTSPKVN